jgi:hypothetical protein
MKLKVILECISRKFPDNYIRDIAEAVGVYESVEDDAGRLVYYWVKTWYCTDAWVGVRAYYLDDVLVAVSEQPGRKFPEEFKWVSQEAFLKVKAHIESLVIKENEDEVPLLDVEEDFPDGYRVDFRNQLLEPIHKHVLFENRVVKVVWPQPKPETNNMLEYHIDKNVVIIDMGVQKTVPLSEVLFAYGTP